MTVVERIVAEVRGATIADVVIEDEEGDMRITLSDGRVLLLRGEFSVGLYGKADRVH